MQATILIVHRDVTVRRLLRAALRNHGHETREVPGAFEALMAAAGSNRPIDLLLTDVALEGIDGFRLAERMESAFPAMRVVYLTGREPIAGVESRPTLSLADPAWSEAACALVRDILAADAPKKGPASAAEAFTEAVERQTA
jgi:DNA-binding NtrC family response regulator